MTDIETAAAQTVAPSGPLVREKIPASSDTNLSTAETVSKMCEYIHAGARDPAVRHWYDLAVKRYALGRTEPLALCWAWFWMAKHSVEYRRDEPRLFRIGEPEALDLLIAPAVLVRMARPAEDCDGFTMLLSAFAEIGGLKPYIVTICADPRDPERWSHVFCIVELPDGSTVALDGSHGPSPGWMVPREHILKLQAWDMSGHPANIKLPQLNTLHGYVRTRRGMRGLGQCTIGGIDPATGDTVAGCGGGGAGIDWGSIINNAISGASRVAQTAFLQPGTSFQMTPTGVVTSAANVGPYGGSLMGPGISATFTSILPWLIGGGILLFAVSSMGSRR